jgi:hypothetical protein
LFDEMLILSSLRRWWRRPAAAGLLLLPPPPGLAEGGERERERGRVVDGATFDDGEIGGLNFSAFSRELFRDAISRSALPGPVLSPFSIFLLFSGAKVISSSVSEWIQELRAGSAGVQE